jgi:hypothetical protein
MEQPFFVPTDGVVGPHNLLPRRQPDRHDEPLAGAVLERNGAGAFCFRTEAAARTCLRRLVEGAQ